MSTDDVSSIAFTPHTIDLVWSWVGNLSARGVIIDYMSPKQGLVRIINSHSLNVSFILPFIISPGRLYIERCKNAPVSCWRCYYSLYGGREERKDRREK